MYFIKTEIVKTDINLDFKYTIPIHIYLTYLGMWKDIFLKYESNVFIKQQDWLPFLNLL